jgi:hypothetical protein
MRGLRASADPEVALMKRRAFASSVICIAIVASTLTGCGNGEGLVPVSGKVLLDGQPLTQGNVITLPPAGRGASGIIQPDGTFQLKTGKDDGAKPGTHKVAVVAYASGPGQGPESGTGQLLVPKKYTSPDTSELTIEINSSGDNHPVFELSSK